MERRNIQVPPVHGGEAVAKILHDGLGVPHSTAKGLIDAGCVSVNGRPARGHGQRCAGGDVVEVVFDPARHYHPVPLPRDGRGFHVVHEDKDIVVVDKMPGVLSSPAPGEEESLAERIADSLRNRGIRRPQLFVIHRLDRHTSGLLVFAKSQRALESIAAQFESREAGRIYSAVVEGRVEKDRGTITSWLMEDARTLSVRTTSLRGAGKRAITHFEVVERLAAATVVQVRLETGRKHQIRIHFAEIGHPVMGDRRYGPGSPSIPRVALHAERLSFRHPRTLEAVSYESPWPDDLEALVRQLRKVGADLVTGSSAEQRGARVHPFPDGLMLADWARPVDRAHPRLAAATTTTSPRVPVARRLDQGLSRGGRALQMQSGRTGPHDEQRRSAEQALGSQDRSRESPPGNATAMESSRDTGRAREWGSRAPASMETSRGARLARERAVGFKPRDAMKVRDTGGARPFEEKRPYAGKGPQPGMRQHGSERPYEIERPSGGKRPYERKEAHEKGPHEGQRPDERKRAHESASPHEGSRPYERLRPGEGPPPQGGSQAREWKRKREGTSRPRAGTDTYEGKRADERRRPYERPRPGEGSPPQGGSQAREWKRKHEGTSRPRAGTDTYESRRADERQRPYDDQRSRGGQRSHDGQRGQRSHGDQRQHDDERPNHGVRPFHGEGRSEEKASPGTKRPYEGNRSYGRNQALAHGSKRDHQDASPTPRERPQTGAPASSPRYAARKSPYEDKRPHQRKSTQEESGSAGRPRGGPIEQSPAGAKKRRESDRPYSESNRPPWKRGQNAHEGRRSVDTKGSSGDAAAPRPGEGKSSSGPASRGEKPGSRSSVRKPWEFRQKGMTRRRELRRKIAAARAKRERTAARAKREKNR